MSLSEKKLKECFINKHFQHVPNTISIAGAINPAKTEHILSKQQKLEKTQAKQQKTTGTRIESLKKFCFQMNFIWLQVKTTRQNF